MSDYFFQLVAIRNKNLSELTRRLYNNMYCLIYPVGEIATRMYDESSWMDNPGYYTVPSRRLDAGNYSLFLFGFMWGYGSVRACNNVNGTPLVRVSTTQQLGSSSIAELGVLDDNNFVEYIIENYLNLEEPHLSLILRPESENNRGFRCLRLV